MKDIEKVLKERVEERGFTLENLTSEERDVALQETKALCEGKVIFDSILDNIDVRMRILSEKKE